LPGFDRIHKTTHNQPSRHDSNSGHQAGKPTDAQNGDNHATKRSFFDACEKIVSVFKTENYDVRKLQKKSPENPRFQSWDERRRCSVPSEEGA
jgi:hypothetical protein